HVPEAHVRYKLRSLTGKISINFPLNSRLVASFVRQKTTSLATKVISVLVFEAIEHTLRLQSLWSHIFTHCCVDGLVEGLATQAHVWKEKAWLASAIISSLILYYLEDIIELHDYEGLAGISIHI